MKIKYKSIGHWFSYNWGWIAAVLAAGLLFFYLSSQNNTKIEPDYIITWVGRSNLSLNEENSIKQAVYDCVGDVNTEINQYIIDYDPKEGDTSIELYYQNAMKLLGEIQLGECSIFLLEDPEGFQQSTSYINDDYVLLENPKLQHTAYLAMGQTEKGKDLYTKLLEMNKDN